MRYHDDKGGSKLMFLALLATIVYLAFFDFDIPVAYRSTVSSIENLFRGPLL